MGTHTYKLPDIHQSTLPLHISGTTPIPFTWGRFTSLHLKLPHTRSLYIRLHRQSEPTSTHPRSPAHK